MSFRARILLPIILVMAVATTALALWLALTLQEWGTTEQRDRQSLNDDLAVKLDQWRAKEREQLEHIFRLQLDAWLANKRFQREAMLDLFEDLNNWREKGYLSSYTVWDSEMKFYTSSPELHSPNDRPAPTFQEREMFSRIRSTLSLEVAGLVAYVPIPIYHTTRSAVFPDRLRGNGPGSGAGIAHAQAVPPAGRSSALPAAHDGPVWFARILLNFTPPRADFHVPMSNTWEQRTRTTIVTVVLAMAAMTLITVLVFYFYTRRAAIRPIERLEAVARRVGKGDYSMVVERTARADEMGTLINTFADMLADLNRYKTDMEGRVSSAAEKIKETQKGLIVAQRLAAMGSLASGIAHEINNPLSGMLNAVRRLQKSQGGADEQLDTYLELLADGLQRIQHIVQKLLQFSPRRVAGGEVKVADVVERAVALKAHDLERQGVRVQRRVPANLPPVAGDEGEVLQVILNLFINAMDSIDDGSAGGTVTISARELAGEVCIDVADNGCGMTEEQKNRCFDMFYSTKEQGKGTGLGLAIVHDIIHNHGGRMAVESEPGQGSTFRIFLPARREK